MNGSLSTRFGVHDDNPISRINVKPRSTGVLTSMLSRDGPPDELYLKTANMDVGIEEYQNKTWVYDFRHGLILILFSRRDLGVKWNCFGACGRKLGNFRLPIKFCI